MWEGFTFDLLAFFAHVRGRYLRLRCLRVDTKIEGVRIITYRPVDVEPSVPLLPQLLSQAVSRNLDGIYSDGFGAPCCIPRRVMR